MATKPAKPAEQTFETAMERLEQIVEQMESDKLALEDLLSCYEEGAKLVTICQERLDRAEQRIEIITRGPSGKVELKEFQPAAETGSNPPQNSSLPAGKPAAADPADASLF